MTQRAFNRYHFALPKEATLITSQQAETVFLKDISIDGVCFMLNSGLPLTPDEPLELQIEACLPESCMVEMKLTLVSIEHPIYRAMWNPTNEKQGVTLLKWLKRLMGQESQFYT